ncbi:MAG: NADH-quinone oxidoreductase subunit L [Verrucomicrobia bacterium]|nr:NADH-quinone oxidoreductase subunit L [Verrucomicrobiota bacterium]
MSFNPQYLFLIPLLPLVAAGVSALIGRHQRKLAATLAIGSMALAFLISCAAFAASLNAPAQGEVFRQVFNFNWFQLGEGSLRLGFILDPLTAVMLVMVTFVGLLIFIYSAGYMAHDENFKQFFCFLSLFAAAMLGLLISNSLLLLFICWELVGLASYLLIGFWFQKPSAAAAAKKAFITTRIGDIGLFLGMLWLYGKTGTLLFYDGGNGCLESSALTQLVAQTAFAGMALSTVIALLIFCGAVGKSGQVPLHVWLPDAMEGPTPVSALIHAATMVAAGVFLMARVYPLVTAQAGDLSLPTTAAQVITFVGAITAVFAALIAVGQNDLKRILAYSTVSQLGFMMIGLGVGGVAVAMFHLITHAFFKALLFLGAGSVIHGCHEEQDIRKMGGLRKFMPVTFATYAIGMLALCGVPFFAGFWSKDEILHAAHAWPGSHIPFYLAIIGAFLTAFYMTRQVCYVFFGMHRGDKHHAPHESPRTMTVPLTILAVFAVILGFLGTPAWPWFSGWLTGHPVEFNFGKLLAGGALGMMVLSALIACGGIGLGWWVYAKAAAKPSIELDPLEKLSPVVFGWLRGRLFIDELYAATVIRLTTLLAVTSDWLDRVLWGGMVQLVGGCTNLFSRLNLTIDNTVVNGGFDQGCEGLRESAGWLSRLRNGQLQNYLRTIGAALFVLLLFLIWGRQ